MSHDHAASIHIRAVHDVAGCDHFVELQRLVWGGDPVELVPNHITITVIKNGGMLLGAYAKDGPAETGGMVGAAFWWLGAIDAGANPPGAPPKLKVCSHMVGVVPAWQGTGIGLRLKLAQRRAVLAQGITDWVTWTYDPLLRVNGVLNIHRLGATCNTYLREVYGELRDDLNRGVPSDRCQVDWRLNSPHVLRDLDPPRQAPSWDPAALEVLAADRRADGFLQPVAAAPRLDGRPAAIPVPEDIAAIRRADGALAMAWRIYLREMLEQAFAAGYTLVDCVQLAETGWYYVLVREYV